MKMKRVWQHMTPDIRIGGVVRCSSCDWPDHLVATIFCQGCSWRCRYCQNPDLIPSKSATSFGWDKILAFLSRRQKLLDGVVFSGGEPTLQAALSDAIDDVRALGLKVGLHTAGASPARLKTLWGRVDWVGFDVKAPFSHYAPTVGYDVGANVHDSLIALLESGTPYEVRTTVHPKLLPPAALERLGNQLADMGVTHWVVQAFRSIGCQDEELVKSPIPPLTLPSSLQARFEHFLMR